MSDMLGYNNKIPKMGSVSDTRLSPRPDMKWVFVDEHPDSLNDGLFTMNKGNVWIDYPAAYHNGACGFSFADGHAEVHKWVGSTIQAPVKGALMTLNVPAKDSLKDIIWWSENTTVAR